MSLPLATRHMADLGADVIKIERPDGGDFARGYDSHVKGQSTYFVWLNRGKRSLTLNLKDQRSQEIARRLAADADVARYKQDGARGVEYGVESRKLRKVHRDQFFFSSNSSTSFASCFMASSSVPS